MILATVKIEGNNLWVRRENATYFADIRAAAGLWCGLFGGLAGFDLAIEMFFWMQSRIDNINVPASPFLTLHQLLLLAMLEGAMVLANLIPVFAGLRSPKVFTFDGNRDSFLVEGHVAGQLDNLHILIQDSFGPSRRAFRITARVLGKDYVLAHTQRFTTAILFGKEYPQVATQEGLQRQYWFNRWADYEGDKTGFDPTWPEYREIFDIYKQLTNHLQRLNTKISTAAY